MAQEVLRGHDHAGRAEAALQRVAGAEGVLQVGHLAGIGKPFDRVDAGTFALDRQRQAGAHDDAVEAHRAGAANAVFAAEMGAREAAAFAQGVAEMLARIDAKRHRLAVHDKRDDALVHAEAFRVSDATRSGTRIATARRSSVRARCSRTGAVT